MFRDMECGWLLYRELHYITTISITGSLAATSTSSAHTFHPYINSPTHQFLSGHPPYQYIEFITLINTSVLSGHQLFQHIDFINLINPSILSGHQPHQRSFLSGHQPHHTHQIDQNINLTKHIDFINTSISPAHQFYQDINLSSTSN